MRQEQRSMASKAAELEMDINEHRYVAHIPPVHSQPHQLNCRLHSLVDKICYILILFLFIG